MSSAQLYDTIGSTYAVTRRTEPRIAAQVWAALGDARTVLNVGAGTGSYEPPTVTSSQSSRRRSCVRSVHPTATIAPGIVVYRLHDRLFFANANYVKGRIREAVEGAPGPVRWVVFDAEAVSQMDATGVAALGETIDALKAEGTGFVVARLKDPMRRLFEDARLTDRIGKDPFYSTVRDAVSGA
jgi:MFS superfamily sulfate permease-like transporter